MIWKPTPPTFPYRVTRGINSGKARWDGEVGDDEETGERERERKGRKKRKSEKEGKRKREKIAKRVFMEQKNIDRSHTCIYTCAHTTSLLITDNI